MDDVAGAVDEELLVSEVGGSLRGVCGEVCERWKGSRRTLGRRLLYRSRDLLSDFSLSW